jgi:hypothetical protein
MHDAHAVISARLFAARHPGPAADLVLVPDDHFKQVLLGQLHPFVASLKVANKWVLMLLAQGVSTVAAAATAAWPSVAVITGARAAHGAAAVVTMIYCLVLLIEVSPGGQLGLGIALVTAGRQARASGHLTVSGVWSRSVGLTCLTIQHVHHHALQ